MKKFLPLTLLMFLFAFTINAQNLAVNGDFETWTDGAPDGWTIIDDGITVTPETTIVAPESATSISIDVTTKDQGITDFRQVIDVIEGTKYDLSVKVYHTGGTIKFRWYLGTYGEYSDNSITGEWQTLTASFTAAASEALEIGFRFYDQTDFVDSEIVYIDDFTMTAPADVEAPVWAESYPKASNVIETSFDIAAQLNETSTVYYVVLESAATAPSLDEVKAGTGAVAAVAVAAGNFVAGTSETMEAVTGLTENTEYTVYLVAEDDESIPNVQADVVNFLVTPMTPPSVLYLADFSSALDPFTQFSESGDTKLWLWKTDYAEMNGYQSPDAEIDWLISPEIDLTGITSPTVSFSTYYNYGTIDETHHLKVYYSTNYDGNTENVLTSEWVEIPFTSPEKKTWTEIGPIDVSVITGVGYFAFVYDNPDNYSTWRIDDAKILGYAPVGSDASLSELMVSDAAIADFEAAKTSYTIDLPLGTTQVPVVTYTTTDDEATSIMTSATNLAGDEAARTTSIVVTSLNGSNTQTYTVLFNPILKVDDIAALRAATDFSRTYSIAGEVVLTQKDSYRNKKYFEDASGAIEIDDSDGIITTDYTIGQGVVGLTGTLNDYFDYLQFIPVTDPGEATLTPHEVVPQVITIDELTTNYEAYEAEFVKIEGVSFADASGSFADGKDYVVSVGENNSVFRTGFYGVISGTIPNMADIQGVALWHYSAAKVAPRMASDLMAYSSDASLSDLMIDETSIDGFVSTTIDYAVTLPVGTTTVPTLTYTVADIAATAVITDATDLSGEEAARTSTVEVSAQDGTTMTYSVVFSFPSSDASLSSLLANDVTVTDFDAATLSYAVLLDVGTTDIPVVTYTINEANATAVVTDLTNLNGDEAARTTTVLVTAEDGTTANYSIVFTVDNTGIGHNLAAQISLYPVPAGSDLFVKGLGDTQSFEIVNILGSVVKTVTVVSDQMRVNLNGIDAGVYMLRTEKTVIRFIKK